MRISQSLLAKESERANSSASASAVSPAVCANTVSEHLAKQDHQQVHASGLTLVVLQGTRQVISRLDKSSAAHRMPVHNKPLSSVAALLQSHRAESVMQATDQSAPALVLVLQPVNRARISVQSQMVHSVVIASRLLSLPLSSGEQTLLDRMARVQGAAKKIRALSMEDIQTAKCEMLIFD